MMRRFYIYTFVLFVSTALTISCADGNNEENAEFTGNEVTTQLIPGTVQGSMTTGTLE